MSRVVVLGGGFGGLAAATALRTSLDANDEVILVARDHQFAMGWTKIWDLVGIRPLSAGTRDLPALNDRGIRFVHADLHTIDPEATAVITSEGDLEADGLIVALGAGSAQAPSSMLDGHFGHDLYSFQSLPAEREALARIEGGQILVGVMGQPFKCPPAPFEAILSIDEYLRKRGDRDKFQLTLTTPSPSALPVAGPAASQVIADALAAHDIDLHLEHLITQIDPTGERVIFDTGRELHADLVFGVPGAAPPAVVAASPLAGNGGWTFPEPTTLATNFPRVYAVGDCTTVPTATAALPKAGVFADAEGVVAANNLAADLGHAEHVTFDGHGYCYLEFPGRKVAFVEGDFFAQPKPQVAMADPTTEAFQRKVDFERDRLTAWFGG